jgi:hypothetical protein
MKNIFSNGALKRYGPTKSVLEYKWLIRSSIHGREFSYFLNNVVASYDNRTYCSRISYVI